MTSVGTFNAERFGKLLG